MEKKKDGGVPRIYRSGVICHFVEVRVESLFESLAFVRRGTTASTIT